MNTATLPPPAVVPARTIFRVFPLALPEPLDSQLARAGFAPWMIAADYDSYSKQANKIGKLAAFAQFEEALAGLTPSRGIGRLLWQTKITETITFSDGRVTDLGETNLWKLVTERHEREAVRVAREALEKRAIAKDRRTFKRSLNRIAA